MPHKFTAIEAWLQYTQHALNSASKAFCTLGVLPVPAAKVVAEVLGTSETEFNLLVDSNGIRHTLKQHGLAKSKAGIAE